MLTRLARDKGMSVVAEGVETEAQASALAACGVTLGQGYLVARPLPFEAFSAQFAPAARAAGSKARAA
jgi:EAL domain-containing protein (putative c-di-GMP-specific phosphodiesterase class I)